MTDMHRAPGLKFPKGTPPVRVGYKRIDRVGSRLARVRSTGRCEIIIDGVRCQRKAIHVHHMLKGRGQRGRGISALAKHKQHACFRCHDLIERHDVERVGGIVPLYTDTYRTKRRP